MKKLLALLLCYPLFAAAQCAEDPDQHMGTYRKDKPTMYSVGAFGKKNIVQITSRLDAIAAILQQALPQPKGCTLSWTPMPYEQFRLSRSQHAYYSYWFVQPFYCDAEKHKIVADETPLSPFFTVNGIDNRAFEKIKETNFKNNMNRDSPLLINGRQLYELPPLAKEKLPVGTLYQLNNGCDMFGNQHTWVDLCGFNVVIITKPGKELFSPVTREQYLSYLVAQADDDFKTYKWPTFENVNHTSYPTHADFEAFLAKLVKEKQDNLKRIHAFLDNMSSRERQLPASVNNDQVHGYFSFDYQEIIKKLDNKIPFFTSPGTGRQLVTINEEYWDASIPAYIPQLLSFSWQINPNRKITKDFNEVMMKQFNYQAMADLLGK